jgi:trypsin-like peptidase
MKWEPSVEKIGPYVVKIDTPTGSGSGFLFAFNEEKTLCGIATALHVVDDTDAWRQPIKINNHLFHKTAYLCEPDRSILKDTDTDSAVILFERSQLDLPEDLIPLRPIASPISIGAEVGWLGFPAIAPLTLCFFSGTVSARQDSKSYLIDGVAIKGVSGGPVFFQDDAGKIQFVGVVSAYRAAAGESLPGLLVARDVSHFHSVLAHLKTVDEAKKKDAESKPPPENAGPKLPVNPTLGSPDQAAPKV